MGFSTKTLIGSRLRLALFLLIGSNVHAIPITHPEYEYVVIGSGPGGGPLAANLARKGHSVLLLEAGEDQGNNPLQKIPSMSVQAAEDPTMSWEFFVDHYSDTEQAYRDSKYTWRQTNGSLYVGTSPPKDAEPLGIYYPRVGTLGGCGNHNAMNAALPPDNDWDAIAALTCDSSWKAVNMRKYFEKIERNNYLPEGTPGHGFSGYLGTNQNPLSPLESDDAFFAIIKAGLNVTRDADAQTTAEASALLARDMNRVDPARYEHERMYLMPIHMDAKFRRSSAQTYLRDTVNELTSNGSQRYPLTISTSSLATKVLFNSNSSSNAMPTAIGVDYLHGAALYKADRRFDGTRVGTPMTAYASKEVIVAGGAFNTPQILKLSGIGPREELQQFGIPVVVDLPAVGVNLQDNYEGGVEAVGSVDFLNTYENCTNLTPGDPCLRQWENGTGPYTQGGAPVAMLARSSMSENNDTDLFFFGGAGSIFRGYFPGFSRITAPLGTFWWSVVKMQVQNRAGTVKLRSADPQDMPLINFNYFKEGRDHDLQALAEGVDLARRIFNQTERPYALFENTEPGNDVKQGLVDESWGHHASCSCAMGPEGATSTCVDSQFRVQGVSKLRVVDASIFPRVPGAFPIIPTFMISEKATDFILQDA